MLKNTFIFAFASLLFSCTGNKQKSDVLIYNATIYTVDSAFTTRSAMAISQGRIVETGSSDDLLKKYEAMQMLDMKGRFIYPGFIDAHCHFLGYGLGLGRVNLVGTQSFNEVLKRVEAFASKNFPFKDEAREMNINTEPETDWIIGRGWDQNDWEQKEMPDNRMLDSLFPNRPVFLQRIDGHAALVNSEALRRAGITTKTKVAGGEIILRNNTPTGVLVDNAVDLIKSLIPPVSSSEAVAALLNAQQDCLAMGITTVDDAGLMKKDIDVIDSLHKNGALLMRVYAMLSDSAPNYQHYLKAGPYKTERLNVRAFKFYADGALGSRGACLKQDYEDKKSWKGFLLNHRRHFEEKTALLAKTSFQVATHCIGDSAYKIILQAYKQAGAGRPQRWRIEHAQVVSPEEMTQSDAIIPSVQPTHATSDMYWLKERLGKTRARHAYAFKDLLRHCGLVALGTDFPVEDISPFKTFYAAVARLDAKGFPPGGFQNENALTRQETIKGMTIWAAYSNFEEAEKGSLEKGKLADFVVLDLDLLNCPIEQVLHAKVLYTFINGNEVYTFKN